MKKWQFSRREFMTTSAAAAGSALLPRVLLASSRGKIRFLGVLERQNDRNGRTNRRMRKALAS